MTPKTETHQPRGESASGPKLNGKSVLVVDDDAVTLRALSEVLADEGAVVTTAYRAAEAMEHLTNHVERFDLIIAALRMLILDGRTILRTITVAFPRVPVVIMTPFYNPELEAECLAEGAAAFIGKPLHTPQLLAAIARALSTRRTDSPGHRGIRR